MYTEKEVPEVNFKGDPFNFKRKFYHLFGLIIPIVFYFDLFNYFQLNLFKNDTRSITFYILLFLSTCMIIVEILRFRFDAWQRFFLKVAGKLIKEKEKNKIHASVPYFIALTIIIGFAPKEIAVLSVIFLLFGDPVAAYIGGKYGTIRFYNKKSLQGTLGGIISAFIFGSIFLVIITLVSKENSSFSLWKNNEFLFIPLITLLGGSIFAFIFEVFSRDGLLDDNLTIPLGSTLVMTLLLSLIYNKSFLYYIYSINDLIYFK